jgi:hypothetical protein
MEGRAKERGQLSFMCSCGAKLVELKTLGCCRTCYDRQDRSLRWFGGLRDRILKRDRYRCRGCGARSRLVVHHRDRRNEEELLLTLCIGCHNASSPFVRTQALASGDAARTMARMASWGNRCSFSFHWKVSQKMSWRRRGRRRCPRCLCRQQLNLPTLSCNPWKHVMAIGFHPTPAAATAACHLRIESFFWELVLTPNPQGIVQRGTVQLTFRS